MLDEAVPSVGLIGRTIAGKYAIESLLGVGAMGAVFKARHLGLEQSVAVKVMHSHFLAEPKFAERFRREAQATVRLDHPNSVRVLDFGEEPDGLLYLVMELLNGRDLAHVIVEDWPISNERIVGIMRQIVGALGAAHDAEIIHRDLKPENIMVLSRVNDDGDAVDVCKVCDFGIAQLGDARTSRAPATTKLTSRGLIIGTPEYMSPEQGRGDPLDARADLYALGVILYELLTGELPFQADSAIGIILKHASHAVTPPSTLQSSVHPGLEEICLRAMRKDAGARFQSAREMRAAVIALGSDLSESPSGVGPVAILRSETETAMAVAAPAKKHAPSRVFVSVALVVALLPVVAWGSHRLLTPVTVAPAALSAPTPPAPPTEKNANTLPSLELTASAINGAPASLPRQAVSLPNTSPAPVTRKSVGRPSERELGPAPSAVIAIAPEVVPPVVHADPPPPLAAITPPVSEAAPSRPVPTLEASNARVTVGAVSNEQGVLRRDVVSAVTRLGRTMTGCYQDDLRLTMIPKNGPGTLHLETDGSGTVVKAHARVPFSPAMASCIERAATGVRIAGVDTGDAAADLALQFDLQ